MANTFPMKPMYPNLLLGVVSSAWMYLDPFVFELFRRFKSFRPVMPVRHNAKAYSFLPFDDKDISECLEFVARLAIFLGAACGDLVTLDYGLFEVRAERNLDSQKITCNIWKISWPNRIKIAQPRVIPTIRSFMSVPLDTEWLCILSPQANSWQPPRPGLARLDSRRLD